MTESIRKFGYELEYASRATEMVNLLHRQGLMQTNVLHDYHCTCAACSFQQQPPMQENHFCDSHCSNYGCWNDPLHHCERSSCPRTAFLRTYQGDDITQPADLRAQRDSTANGEFITRPITDWGDFHRITDALTAAATEVGATVNSRCGLHVHVDTSSDREVDRYGDQIIVPRNQLRARIVPAAYMAFERYFAEIVAPGSSVRKRDMNSTLMEATRQFIGDGLSGGGSDAWMDMGRGAVDDYLAAVIQRDRHVDLNWNRRHMTWEFRVFNATNAPWRIELACRMATAFVEAAPQLRIMVESVVRGSKFWPEGCDSPWGEIIRPAYSALSTSHPTKKPIIPMDEFIDALAEVDPDLRPLIERQANYMRTRYATQIEVAV